MHELIKNALCWTGIRGKKYDISNPQYTGKKDLIYLSAYGDKHFTATEGPYASDFNMGLSIGSKRFWGRLEWIIGISSVLGGSVLATSGEQSLPSIVFIGLGIFLTRGGKERRDIASSIIDKFNKKIVF